MKAVALLLVLGACTDARHSITAAIDPPGATPAPRDEVEPAPPAQRRAVACPPRASWPERMACVEGGTFTLGNASGQPDEQPEGEVFVETFYMDMYETTNAEFETCIRRGGCRRPMRFRHFMDDDQPMVAVSWADAVRSCEQRGKRLPTDAEWEHAAGGPEDTEYPWGDDPRPCTGALVQTDAGHGCGTELTHRVGSLPAGHYGLFDMAGNVHEWTADWYSPCLRGCRRECGDACFGENPKGPCDGAASCPGHVLRSVRGGSWYWPLERARVSARRGAPPANYPHAHRFGFRCAKSL